MKSKIKLNAVEQPSDRREPKGKAPEFGPSLGYTVRLYLKTMSGRPLEGRGGETGRSVSKTRRFLVCSTQGPRLEALPVSIQATGIQNQSPKPPKKRALCTVRQSVFSDQPLSISKPQFLGGLSLAAAGSRVTFRSVVPGNSLASLHS